MQICWLQSLPYTMKSSTCRFVLVLLSILLEYKIKSMTKYAKCTCLPLTSLLNNLPTWLFRSYLAQHLVFSKIEKIRRQI